MSLGEFQEDMHVGESLPIIWPRQALHAFHRSDTSCTSAQYSAADPERGAGAASLNEPEL